MNKPTYKQEYTQCSVFPYGGRLVYGTSGLGGVWGEINPEESVKAIFYALENGVRCFDTAPSYSNAEIYLGMALKDWKGEKPFISTKVGRLRGETAFDFKLDYTNDALETSLHQSLQRLGVEKIDLLFLHEPQCVPLHEIDRIISCLHRFKEQGLIDYIGIGGNPPHSFYPFIKNDCFDAVSGFLKLDACNLSALEKDIPFFQLQGIAYYAASSLHFSLLGNRLKTYMESGPTDFISQSDINNAARLSELAKEIEMPLPTIAQRYLFSIAEADRIVIGARTVAQIKNTLADWMAGPLPRPLFDRITNNILKFS